MKKPLHALMVEDSERDAHLLGRELARGGFDATLERVETAKTLKDALDRERWDIVFCDFTLPKFDGLGALELIRQTDADLPVIFVSGTMGEDVAVAAMKAGAQDYLMKDNLARLAAAVERELREAGVRREHRRLEAERDQLIKDLQDALAQIKRLSGLLPICAGCKRIRTDNGTWQRIETFIAEHSEAHFTHGLCPDCTKHLYPDLHLTYVKNDPG